MLKRLNTLAALSLVLLGGCATSMLTAPCDKPSVSNSALPSVYMVVVPYVSGTQTNLSTEHDEATDAVNEIAGFQALRMAADTSDMHVTLLRGNSEQCDIEDIYLAFAKKGGRLNRKLMSTVVFYWGEVYQSNDKLLVQSHLRVLWKDSDEPLIDVYAPPSGDAEPLQFTGYLPYSTISFPPRLLSVGVEGAPGRNHRRGLRAKAAPRDNAADVPLSGRFLVIDRSANWVEVESIEDARRAWISLEDSQFDIKQLLPELSFAHAVASYISNGQVPDPRSFKATRNGLEEYRSAPRGGTNMRTLVRPDAIADAIEGALYLRAAGRSGNRDTARRFLDRAANELSANSAVLNLAAVSEIDTCCIDRETATRIDRRLQQARKLDGGNEVIARNLLNWYRLLETKDRALWPDGLTDVQTPARELAQLLERK